MKKILKKKCVCVYVCVYIYIYIYIHIHILLLADTDIYRLKLNSTGGTCKACSVPTMEVYNKGTGEC